MTEETAPKTRKPRAEMTEGRLEIHVMTKVEDWLRRLTPTARRRVAAWVADRARQLEIEEAHGKGKALVGATATDDDDDAPVFGRK